MAAIAREARVATDVVSRRSAPPPSVICTFQERPAYFGWPSTTARIEGKVVSAELARNTCGSLE